MKRKLLIIALPILLFAAAAYLHRHAVMLRHTQQVFGGQPLRDALNDAGEVTAQRLHYLEGRDPGKLDSYVDGEIIQVDTAQALEAKRLLQDPSSYEWSRDTEKSCILDYGILLTFRSTTRPLRVAFCFNCLILGIYDGAGDTANRLRRRGF